MSQQLSFLEQMEYLYVLNETKQLLTEKLKGDQTEESSNSIKEDLRKIDEEIGSIIANNPQAEGLQPLNFVFPYYEDDKNANL